MTGLRVTLMPALVGLLLSTVVRLSAAETTAPAGEHLFTLREVSAFDEGGQEFVRGQTAECQVQPKGNNDDSDPAT